MRLRDWKTNSGTFAIVTGASSGMGAEYSRQLAHIGYNVLIVSNQEKEGRDTAARIAKEVNCTDATDLVMQERYPADFSKKQLSGKQCIISIYRDLAKPDAAQELFDWCQKNSIEADVLVNNAGIFFFEDVTSSSTAKIETILNLHIKTVTMLCRLFGEQMKKRFKEDGRRKYIINMSSISVYTPYCGIALYSATKSFIRSFSLAFYLEMKHSGVNVTVVCPGAVATSLYNLKSSLMKIGVGIGVISKVPKVVKHALSAAYRGKRECVPAAIDHIFKPLFAMLPAGIKFYIREKLKLGE